ncbi:uncharacterized protein TRUGW13939_02447 [Talaromyces rugulosus]|uniref:Major facilitator superfamily (MFS) profile domain-containing protein n=1 Tax=Talaromyces rugulosus TaxID=121627 RepID=A0A7H8QPG2_TALRU|nr:uncharacterized protein TRUGW13939_02447 [Talaromyces rugulosus]QKX55355.1 hypothetical protein TRUGW13939_02447 [Talaromyces rugulosus]
MAPSESTSPYELQNSQETDQAPGRQLKALSWFFVVFALLAALFLFALDNTIVADVQPSIISSLGGIDKLPWITVAFALGAISTNLLWLAPSSYGRFFSCSPGLGVNCTAIWTTRCCSCPASSSLKRAPQSVERRRPSMLSASAERSVALEEWASTWER